MTEQGMAENLTPREQRLGEFQSEIGELFPVPRESADAYGSSISGMVLDVNQAMMNHPRLSELVGGCPVNIMRKNHHNHARFMQTVFLLNSPEMLANALPWVYRVYSSRGFSYDYFPAELSAWQEAVEEHLDSSMTDPILEVYRFMRSHHEEVIELSRLTPVQLFRAKTWSQDLETLLAHLFEGSWQKAAHILTSSFEQDVDPGRRYQERVEAVMYRTGALWEEGKISVAQEHLATSTMDRVMAFAYEKQLISEPTKGRALVACTEDELHELGGRIVADLLETDGWDCTFLGADVPAAELVHLATQLSPHIICLSAALPYHLSNVLKTIKMMRKQEELADTRIMVGGLAFQVAPPTTEQLGADGFAPDARGAVKLASKWWEELSEQ